MTRDHGDPEVLPPPLYDAVRRCFDGPRLRAAILSRALTIQGFAELASLHYNTVYDAIREKKPTPRTVIAILETLERRKPMRVA